MKSFYLYFVMKWLPRVPGEGSPSLWFLLCPAWVSLLVYFPEQNRMNTDIYF